MQEHGNTGSTPRHPQDREIVSKDGILPPFGLITFEAIDSEEFRELRGSAPIRVYMVLALYADRGGANCYPRQRTIAGITGMRRQTINAALGQLESVGLIEKGTFEGRICYTLIRPPSKRRRQEG